MKLIIQVLIVLFSILCWIIGFIPILNIVVDIIFWLVSGVTFFFTFGKNFYKNIPALAIMGIAAILGAIPFVDWIPWDIIASITIFLLVNRKAIAGTLGIAGAAAGNPSTPQGGTFQTTPQQKLPQARQQQSPDNNRVQPKKTVSNPALTPQGSPSVANVRQRVVPENKPNPQTQASTQAGQARKKPQPQNSEDFDGISQPSSPMRIRPSADTEEKQEEAIEFAKTAKERGVDKQTA